MTSHPQLPGQIGDGGTLRDVPQSWPVSSAESIFESAYLSLSIDTIVDPDGGAHPRTVARPNNAVGILALDVDGEGPLEAAARELAEEADLYADHWQSLLSLQATPGYSTERWQIYSAHGLTPVPEAERTDRVAEEADMIQWWIPFHEAVTAALEGRITDSMTVSAILAAQALRGR